MLCFRHLATLEVLDVLILVVDCVIVHTVISDMSKLLLYRTRPLQVRYSCIGVYWRILLA